MANQVHPFINPLSLPKNISKTIELDQIDNRPLKSPHLSQVASEANPSNYQMVETLKLKYIDEYNTFCQMRVVENLASLQSLPYKRALISNFNALYQSMVSCLIRIEEVINDFHEVKHPVQGSTVYTEPDTIADGLIKDIKTLESIHMELIHSSSLRHLSTVLEALNMEDDIIDLNEFNPQEWAQKCQTQMNKFPKPKKTKAQAILLISFLPLSQFERGSKIILNKRQFIFASLIF